MQLVILRCASCGANLDVDAETKWVTCQYCGTEFLVDDGLQNATRNTGEHPIDGSPYRGAEHAHYVHTPETGMDAGGRRLSDTSASASASGWGSTNRMLVLGGVLFGVMCIAHGTDLRLRVLGLSTQEWCVFTYAAALVGYYRSCRNKTAKRLVVAYWVFASFILALQIIAWINNKSFALITLP